MIYVAMTFWVLVAVLSAWGVHRLWSALVKPKVLNVALLPGTLVAQTGHVLGLLVTGATIRDAALMGDDESGEPRASSESKPRIPVVGPVIVGLLPIVACAACIYFIAKLFGAPAMRRMGDHTVAKVLPDSLGGVWDMLRDQVTIAESMLGALASLDFGGWRAWVFVYLLICLAVRIAPLPGNIRGSLGAIVVVGVALGAIASLFDVGDPRSQATWAVLSLTVGSLTLLLLVSLLIRGGYGLVQLIRGRE